MNWPEKVVEALLDPTCKVEVAPLLVMIPTPLSCPRVSLNPLRFNVAAADSTSLELSGITLLAPSIRVPEVTTVSPE